MKLKPLEGLRIPDPSNAYHILPPEGEEVTDNMFWQRRIRDGSVEVVKDSVDDASDHTEHKEGAE